MLRSAVLLGFLLVIASLTGYICHSKAREKRGSPLSPLSDTDSVYLQVVVLSSNENEL